MSMLISTLMYHFNRYILYMSDINNICPSNISNQLLIVDQIILKNDITNFLIAVSLHKYVF